MRLHDRLIPLRERLSEWFQGRELVEALSIHLAVRRGESDAYERFTAALALADSRDLFGASWLVAEFASVLRNRRPDDIESLVHRYHQRPETLSMPRIRERFGVLLSSSSRNC